ncbi:MAG: phosphoribosylformylglycinamidine cyclo-ligase [Deltaproteobacteria bacterium]|nr:phosphoribosylformylglycinamidine cyclo-ligase [Deltaproteobacteria bacterium]
MAGSENDEQEQKMLTYKDAGVDIDAGDAAIDGIKDAAKRTHIPGVLGGLGGFGGLFALKDALGEIKDPVLVSGTDGVGTKLLVAIEANLHNTIGQDLVAMCVNDIVTLGAKPLFFLDYFATGKLDASHMQTVVEGIAGACKESGCALLGGETAELPGMYQPGHYDLAGFAVGVVERDAVIDGKDIQEGMAIIGLPSSGLHSNGFSLARHVLLEQGGASLDDDVGEEKLKDLLLAPTRLYGHAVSVLLSHEARIYGMAHITGGGLSQNLPRVLPEGIGVHLDTHSWPEPILFKLIREGGPVAEEEMRRTFNLGIGMCVVVAKKHALSVVNSLEEAGEPSFIIGETTSREGVAYDDEQQESSKGL